MERLVELQRLLFGFQLNRAISSGLSFSGLLLTRCARINSDGYGTSNAFA